MRNPGSRSDLRVLTGPQRSELTDGTSVLVTREAYAELLERGTVHFDSTEERDRAWTLHRERLLSKWGILFRRPRMWFHERGEDPPTSHVVRLVQLGELNARERKAFGDYLTPGIARELAQVPELYADPHLKAAVLKYPELLSGLTTKGVDAFLDSLPAEARRKIEDRQEVHDP